MVTSVFFRLLRFLIMSVACSLPIYIGYFGIITDDGILLLAFLLFVVVMGVDTYRFSFTFWRRKHYYLGLLIPLFLYFIIGVLVWLVFPPFVFNRIFLPLRLALGLGLSTLGSIGIVAIGLTAMLTIVRFLAAKAGRVYSNKFIESKEKI